MQRYGRILWSKVIPTIHALYVEVEREVISLLKQYMDDNKVDGAIVAYDATYSHRNNNADHAVETFIEKTTPWSFALHLETLTCSAKILPQSAEKVMVPRGVMYLKDQGVNIKLLVHDGKGISDSAINIPQAKDTWHVGNNMQREYVKKVTEKTLCVKGCKKKG